MQETNVYVVVYDGFLDSYGCSYYIQGVYSDAEQANDVANSIDRIMHGLLNPGEEYDEHSDRYAIIIPMPLDQGYNLSIPLSEYGSVSTPGRIGGYCE